MKHAFILGTNIYLSDSTTISYGLNGKISQIMEILSFSKTVKYVRTELTINASLSTVDDHPIEIIENKILKGDGITLEVARDRVIIFEAGEDTPVLDVFQLEESTFPHFGTHIANEISAQQPDFVLSIKGNFKINDSYLWIDSERVHVNEDAIASGVINAHNGVVLSSDKFAY